VVVDTRHIDFHPAIVDAYAVLQPVLADVTRRLGMLPSDLRVAMAAKNATRANGRFRSVPRGRNRARLF